MNITEATKRACQEPALLDALSWICVWESERAIDQALYRCGSGTNGAGWDTCFKFCLKSVMDEWRRGEKKDDWIDYSNYPSVVLRGPGTR